MTDLDSIKENDVSKFFHYNRDIFTASGDLATCSLVTSQKGAANCELLCPPGTLRVGVTTKSPSVNIYTQLSLSLSLSFSLGVQYSYAPRDARNFEFSEAFRVTRPQIPTAHLIR